MPRPKPVPKPKLKARDAVALRLLGAGTYTLQQIFGVPETRIITLLAKHGRLPLLASGRPMIGASSFSITPETHKALQLPSCIPLVADSCVQFGPRLLALALELLKR